MGRKLFLAILTALAVIGCFGNNEASARPQHRRDAQITIWANAAPVPVDVIVAIAEMRGGSRAKGIVDGPAIRHIEPYKPYRFKGAVSGRRYSVVVTDLQGNVLEDRKTRIWGETWSIGLAPIAPPAISDPLGEAKAQIAALHQQIAAITKALEARDARIAQLEAQIIGSPPEIFTVIVNPTVTELKVKVGEQGARIASFLYYAPASQGVRIQSHLLDKDNAPGLRLANLRVSIGGQSTGIVQGFLADEEPAIFVSGPVPITVPAGKWVVMDVFADIQATAEQGTYSSAIDIRDVFGVSLTSADGLSSSGEVQGQTVTVLPAESIKG